MSGRTTEATSGPREKETYVTSVNSSICKALILNATAILCLALFQTPPAEAATSAPGWSMIGSPYPSNFSPQLDGTLVGGPGYYLFATNVGGATSSGSFTVSDTLPVGIRPTGAAGNDARLRPITCAVSGQLVTCTGEQTIRPGEWIKVRIAVDVEATSGAIDNEATIEGGGGVPFSTVVPTAISPSVAPFGLIPGPAGLGNLITDADGEPSAQSGSHPYQLSVDLNFPTEELGDTELASAGRVKDIVANMPRGLVVNPAATSVRCTEAEFESRNESEFCPDASQIGTITTHTDFNAGEGIVSFTAPLYNMVPPPGTPAEFAFEPLNALGIGTRLIGSVRSDGDYGLSSITRNIIARPVNPVFGVRATLWGVPSDESHDDQRGRRCNDVESPGDILCPTERLNVPLLTMPGDCSREPLTTSATADSWEEAGRLAERRIEGQSVDGCNKLEFDPAISSQPTTNLVDSPSGLDFDLHVPQAPAAEPAGPATANLKDATVALPPGMALNPSAANGLAACSETQIGYLTEDKESGIHFSKQAQSCPDAAKLGTAEVTTPLLAEYSEDGTRLETDPQTGEAIPRPLHGSVYAAKPFENPFDSLLAIYLVIEDPASGTIAKLAGKVTPDPKTGQLTTVFEESPELPIEDVKLHLFGGARGVLTTPPTCGSHSTTTDLVPWSTPEGVDAHPESSSQTTAAPGGGPCPATEGAAPNSPTMTAGTEAPQAGTYSPFALKLSREDGSQRITGIDTSLPPGLTGKLAGIGQCSEAQIAQAESRRNPEEGRLEREVPSCPTSSEVGTVTVGAGAGPTPFYTDGHAYLAGPYKGAPVSLAVIVPAIAGPFDLGTVVTRVALHIEPETTQIHAVSDPLPTILDGIPLDIRSVALRLGRPGFTLNPTSCEPMTIAGQATSSLGQTALLSQRLQVGGCSSLAFKPKLSLRLEGKVRRTSHPRLIATLKAKEGEANIARAQVKLPHAAFIDQGHIKTVCTRVQWAANTCPGGSVYGAVEAATPLLSYPLTGSVYLRSSAHKLPDLVAKLKGPASQPIEIDLDGKTDSVKGALRNTFEAVPDAPVSTFRLELFGGKRGLIEMSGGFCSARKATVDLTSHSGKIYDTTPVVAAKCPKTKKGKGKKHKKGTGKKHEKRGGHGKHRGGQGSK
jgi:hypothetical protein